MKTLVSLAFLLCISAAFAIKCKNCVSSNSMAECIASEQSVDCASVAHRIGFNADRCVKMSVDYYERGIEFKSFVKTCYTQELCEQGDRSFQHCRSSTSLTCELDCCSGDYCNSGTAPITSILMIASCALMSLFRH